MTREQELKLIEIGLNSLLGTTAAVRIPWNKGLKSPTGSKWTPERRAKFAATMQKKWNGHKRVYKKSKSYVHWTQKPENRKKMLANARHAANAQKKR